MILQKLKTDAASVFGRGRRLCRDHRPRLLQRRPGARRPRTPARSPASTSSASSTSPPPRRSPTASTRRPTRRSSCSTSAAGTFDVSVLEIGDGVFEVKSTAGDNHLGGDNFDKAIVDWLVSEFKKSQGIDLSADPMALQRLYEASEKAKIELSTTQETQINLPFITADASGPKHLDTRPDPRQARRADLRPARPRRRTRQAGDRRRQRQGASRDRATSCSVGGMTRMPSRAGEGQRASRTRSPHRGVNPDEVVAVGASDPGRRASPATSRTLAAARRHPRLTLGIETKGRRDDQADRAQHHDPDAARGEVFSTARGQPAERGDPRAAGRARDGSVPQVARQVPASPASRRRREASRTGRGRLRPRRQRHPSTCPPRISATGKEQKIEIKSGSGLSEDEIKNMVSDAESHADEDRRARELAEARNNGENAAYQAEKQLADLGDQVDSDSKEPHRGRDQGGARVARGRGPGGDQRQDRGAADGLPRDLRGRCTSAPRRPRRPTATARRRPASDSSSDDEDVVDAEVVDEPTA